MKIIKYFLKLFFRYFAYLKCKNKNVLKCHINSFCYFNGNEKFGENVNFNGCKVYGKGTIIFGDNFHSATGLKFLTSYHNYKGDAIPYDSTTITKNINIEDNVWIGMDVTILGGITIGEGAIIQAGSVVSKNVEALSIVGGNPAKAFSSREKEHYFQKKIEQKFH